MAFQQLSIILCRKSTRRVAGVDKTCSQWNFTVWGYVVFVCEEENTKHFLLSKKPEERILRNVLNWIQILTVVCGYMWRMINSRQRQQHEWTLLHWFLFFLIYMNNILQKASGLVTSLGNSLEIFFCLSCVSSVSTLILLLNREWKIFGKWHLRNTY